MSLISHDFAQTVTYKLLFPLPQAPYTLLI